MPQKTFHLHRTSAQIIQENRPIFRSNIKAVIFMMFISTCGWTYLATIILPDAYLFFRAIIKFDLAELQQYSDEFFRIFWYLAPGLAMLLLGAILAPMFCIKLYKFAKFMRNINKGVLLGNIEGVHTGDVNFTFNFDELVVELEFLKVYHSKESIGSIEAENEMIILTLANGETQRIGCATDIQMVKRILQNASEWLDSKEEPYAN